MKLPFHEFCIKTGSLCDECENRIKQGLNSNEELRLSKIFLEMVEKRRSLSDLTLVKALRKGNILVVELGEGDIERIGSDMGELIRSVKGRADTKVLLVESGVPAKTFIRQLSWPNKVLAMNTVWLPDGSRQTKVTLDGRRNPSELRALEEFAKESEGIDIRLEPTTR